MAEYEESRMKCNIWESNMGQISEKTIDIDRILKDKMGAKAKWVPGFLVLWLKRIAHQDEVNKFLWESRDKVGTEWLEECVRYLRMTLVVKGKENLPAGIYIRNGRKIVVR